MAKITYILKRIMMISIISFHSLVGVHAWADDASSYSTEVISEVEIPEWFIVSGQDMVSLDFGTIDPLNPNIQSFRIDNLCIYSNSKKGTYSVIVSGDFVNNRYQDRILPYTIIWDSGNGDYGAKALNVNQRGESASYSQFKVSKQRNCNGGPDSKAASYIFKLQNEALKDVPAGIYTATVRINITQN